MTSTSVGGINVGSVNVLGKTTQRQSYQEYTTSGQGDDTNRRLCDTNNGFVGYNNDGVQVNSQTVGGDWFLGQVPSSCAVASRCSRKDPDVCPVLNGNRSNNNFFNQPPTVDCYYSIMIFDSVQAVVDYKDNFGTTDDYNKVIMPYFCSQNSTMCPTGLRTCSGFLSTANDGLNAQLCNTWAASSPELADGVKRAYCFSRPGQDDCKCLNRSSDPVYRSVKSLGLGSLNDRCWYVNCAVTTQLVTSDIASEICNTDQICQNIVDILNNNGVDINSQIQQTINCKLGTGGGNGGGGTPGGGGTQNSNNSIYLYIIIAGIILAILIFVIIFVFRSS